VSFDGHPPLHRPCHLRALSGVLLSTSGVSGLNTAGMAFSRAPVTSILVHVLRAAGFHSFTDVMSWCPLDDWTRRNDMARMEPKKNGTSSYSASSVPTGGGVLEPMAPQSWPIHHAVIGLGSSAEEVR
jgi:hypothetical protein